MDRDTLALIICTILAFIFLFVGLPILLPDDPPYRVFIQGLTIFCAWLGLIGITRIRRLIKRKDKDVGRIWGYFVVGVAFWLAGECMFAYASLVLNIELPFPSIADLPYTFGYVAMLAGMAEMYNRVRRPLSQTEFVLIFLVIVFALGAIGYTLVPAFTSPQGVDLVSKLLDLVYPVGDTLLIAMSITVILAIRKTSAASAFSLFLLGVLAFGVADLWFSYLTAWDLYYDGHPFDYVYCASYVIWFLGAVMYEVTYKEEEQVAVPAKPPKKAKKKRKA